MPTTYRLSEKLRKAKWSLRCRLNPWSVEKASKRWRLQNSISSVSAPAVAVCITKIFREKANLSRLLYSSRYSKVYNNIVLMLCMCVRYSMLYVASEAQCSPQQRLLGCKCSDSSIYNLYTIYYSVGLQPSDAHINRKRCHHFSWFRIEKKDKAVSSFITRFVRIIPAWMNRAQYIHSFTYLLGRWYNVGLSGKNNPNADHKNHAHTSLE